MSALHINDNPVTAEVVAEHGLTPEEYDMIVAHMGREPNYTSWVFFQSCGRSIAPINLRANG